MRMAVKTATEHNASDAPKRGAIAVVLEPACVFAFVFVFVPFVVPVVLLLTRPVVRPPVEGARVVAPPPVEEEVEEDPIGRPVNK